MARGPLAPPRFGDPVEEGTPMFCVPYAHSDVNVEGDGLRVPPPSEHESGGMVCAETRRRPGGPVSEQLWRPRLNTWPAPQRWKAEPEAYYSCSGHRSAL